MTDVAEVAEEAPRLWRVMQLIEYRRHRAELAEARAANGSQAFRDEMAEIARNWRDLATEAEQLHQGFGGTSFPRSRPRG